MTLQIKKIKDRIHQFSYEKYEGYVCIGYGVNCGLVEELGIPSANLHGTGLVHGRMVPQWGRYL